MHVSIVHFSSDSVLVLINRVDLFCHYFHLDRNFRVCVKNTWDVVLYIIVLNLIQLSGLLLPTPHPSPFACMCIHTFAHMHAYMQTDMHTQTHTHTHTITHTHTHTHTITHTHTHIHIHIPCHTKGRTHTHTITHIHTHTHYCVFLIVCIYRHTCKRWKPRETACTR